MDAIEFLTNASRICAEGMCTNKCPLKSFCNSSYDKQTKETIEVVVKTVEDWGKAHPLKTRLSEYKKIFPDTRLRSDGMPVADPCTISKIYDDGKCAEMIDCDKCRKEFWNEVIE